MCDRLNIRRHEMKVYFRGQLSPSRFEEINKEIHKLGVEFKTKIDSHFKNDRCI
jgi:hypothetical protein